MYCPKCKYEYRDGFTKCADCNVELVEQLENPLPAQKIEPFDGNIEDCNPIKLTSVSNEVDVQLILNLLKNNNIPCFRKSKEAGGYMNIYMGYSVFGEDIYVSERDYSTAMDLLSVMQPNEEQKDVDDSEMDYHVPFYKKSSFYARTILIVAVVFELFMILLKYL